MPRRSQNEPELKNALQDATNSLETIMAEYTASLIRKYFEWPIRMDSELAALRKKLWVNNSSYVPFHYFEYHIFPKTNVSSCLQMNKSHIQERPLSEQTLIQMDILPYFFTFEFKMFYRENEENGTPVGLAERMDESILEQVSLPQMFGSAVKRKKAKRKSKKKSNRLAKLKPPFEQDEGLCEDIDDEISFKHPGPTYLKSSKFTTLYETDLLSRLTHIS